MFVILRISAFKQIHHLQAVGIQTVLPISVAPQDETCTGSHQADKKPHHKKLEGLISRQVLEFPTLDSLSTTVKLSMSLSSCSLVRATKTPFSTRGCSNDDIPSTSRGDAGRIPS